MSLALKATRAIVARRDLQGLQGSRSSWSKFTNSAARVGATTWALNTATSSIRVGLPRGPKGVDRCNIRQTALTNVCFEGKNGHDADMTRCLLLTKSRHLRLASPHSAFTSRPSRFPFLAQIVGIHGRHEFELGTKPDEQGLGNVWYLRRILHIEKDHRAAHPILRDKIRSVHLR